jgi:predicted transcriptional regulator
VYSKKNNCNKGERTVISSRAELKEYLECEKHLYPNTRCKRYKYVKTLRISEFHLNRWKSGGGVS